MKIRKNKTTSVVVCALLIITAVSGISILTDQGVLQTAEAADTGAKPIVGIAVGSAVDTNAVSFRDIAWHPSGDFAVAVGLAGWVFRYEPNTDTWTAVDDGASVTQDLRGITWHQGNSNFVVVGGAEDATNPSAWTTDGNSPLAELGAGTSPKSVAFQDVAIDNSGVAIAVGENGACWQYSAGWTEITDFTTSQQLHSIIYNEYNLMFYIAGYDVGTANGIFYEYNTGLISIAQPAHNGWVGNTLFDLDHDPTSGNVIIVGQDNIDRYDVSSGSYSYLNKATGLSGTETFMAVKWTSPDIAYVVGNDGTNGIFYQYKISDHKVIEMPISSTIGNHQYGIDSLSDNTIISVGDHGSDSAFKISQTSGFDDILTDTRVPHIQYMTLYDYNDALITQRLNSQLDVNAESEINRLYTLEVQVTHEVRDQLNSVEIYAWFDNGALGIASSYPVEADAVRTQAFRFIATYDHIGKTTSFSQIFPTNVLNPDGYGDQQEVALQGGLCSATYAWDGLKDVWTIEFVFAPGPQVRFAPGNAGAFNGPANGDWDKATALATGNSWDLHVNALDIGGGQDNMWGEFGIFRFTSLAVSGLPGTYSGTGAPGQKIELNPMTSTEVKYSANCEHRLYVYVDGDLQGAVDTILATALSVAGGYTAETALTGSGELNSVYLLGDGTPTYVPPRNMYDYSFTSLQTSDETPTPNPVIRWWVDIPVVSEDTYTSSIVYVLEHSG